MECNKLCHANNLCKMFVIEKNYCFLVGASCSEIKILYQITYYKSEDNCVCKWNHPCSMQQGFENIPLANKDNFPTSVLKQQCQNSANLRTCRWLETAPKDIDYMCYASRYGDLKAAFGTNLVSLEGHYVTYGFNEGSSFGLIGGRNRYCGQCQPINDKDSDGNTIYDDEQCI